HAALRQGDPDPERVGAQRDCGDGHAQRQQAEWRQVVQRDLPGGIGAAEDRHREHGEGDCPRVQAPAADVQMFRERLSTPSAASFIASDSDGCAWQIMPMSSAEPRNSMATTASEMSSEAIGPMMCTPRISSVFALAMNLTRPVVSPRA